MLAGMGDVFPVPDQGWISLRHDKIAMENHHGAIWSIRFYINFISYLIGTSDIDHDLQIYRWSQLSLGHLPSKTTLAAQETSQQLWRPLARPQHVLCWPPAMQSARCRRRWDAGTLGRAHRPAVLVHSVKPKVANECFIHLFSAYSSISIFFWVREKRFCVWKTCSLIQSQWMIFRGAKAKRQGLRRTSDCYEWGQVHKNGKVMKSQKWGVPYIGVPLNGWFIRENPTL